MYLGAALKASKQLVGQDITAADFAVFGALKTSAQFQEDLKAKKIKDAGILSWYKRLETNSVVKEAVASLPKDVTTKTPLPARAGSRGASAPRSKKASEGPGTSKAASAPKTQTKDEGKFVDLPGAEMGKVVVRFPPEASG